MITTNQLRYHNKPVQIKTYTYPEYIIQKALGWLLGGDDILQHLVSIHYDTFDK